MLTKKQILKDLQLDDKMFSDRSVMSEISNAKNEMFLNIKILF